MNETSARVIALRVAAAIAVFASCDPGSHNLGEIPATGGGTGNVEPTGGGMGIGGGTAGGIGVTGGGVTTTGGGTAADSGVGPCNCSVEGTTLTMSWECYRATYLYDRGLNATCSNYIGSSMACGLTVIEFYGPRTTVVRDDTGAAVGGESYTDLSDYKCPDDASLHAGIARGGVFPDAGCSSTACSCADGGVNCP